MIQKETLLNITDNSGVKVVKCLEVLKKPFGVLGDIAVVSVQELDLKRGTGKIKKGEIFLCVIVRTKSTFCRADGSAIYFSENAGVLVNDQLTPIGSRIFGSTIRELRYKHMKIVSLFENII